MYQHIKVPQSGDKITVNPDFSLNVPDHPVIPFIEGDGIGIDVTPVMRKVIDAAIEKAYGGKRKIEWMEVYAGEKSLKVYGENVWLPDETLEAMKDFVISIKGPLDDSDRGRHPLTERRHETAPGSLCLPASCPLFPGCAFTAA